VEAASPPGGHKMRVVTKESYLWWEDGAGLALFEITNTAPDDYLVPAYT
jgi:hypothetical protein